METLHKRQRHKNDTAMEPFETNWWTTLLYIFKYKDVIERIIQYYTYIAYSVDKLKRKLIALKGMTLHHLAQIHSVDDFQLFRKKFNELGTIIDQLASYSKVIWLNQYPTIEFTVSEKIHYFNKAIRRLMLQWVFQFLIF